MRRKKLKLRERDLIEIKWLDALLPEEGWFWLKKDHDWERLEKEMFHKIVGYFLKETDKMIAISQGYKEERKKDGDYTVLSPMIIPKISILSIRRIQKAN